MIKYIAFLRGINVGGQKKIKMADLRLSLEKTGFKNVSTYIQSGNILLESPIKDVRTIETDIKKAIERDFGFEVPTLVKTTKELVDILKENPFSEVAERKSLYFTLLHQKPEKEWVDEFEQLEFETEDFHYTATCVYLHCKMGAGKAKLSNNLVEKKLKTSATTRNLNTMLKMVELAG